MTRVLVALALVVAVATAAIVANLALLGYASSSNDQVGKLSPRANLPAAPANVVRPYSGHVEHDRSDD